MHPNHAPADAQSPVESRKSASGPSLTTRLALLYAAIAFCAIAVLGYAMYRKLEAQLILRDDAALVTRVDQIRTLLHDADVRVLIRDKPHLFANMLGNTESLLVIRFPGQAPLISVDPGHTSVPVVRPVDAHAALSLDDVHHVTDARGTPFIYMAAAEQAQGANPAEALEIVSGRLMSERTRMLSDYRRQIVAFALLTAVLAALIAYAIARRGMQPLTRLAAQTASIGIDNLSVRVTMQHAPRELAPLIEGLNHMLTRLERGFTQLSQVSADMAHDLRTPISNLLGQVEVGLQQARDTAYYQHLLGSNFEELQRLSKMIDNMLFLARAEHADHAIARERFQVEQEITRVTGYFEDLADDRNIRLTVGGAATIWADKDLLRRALANLLANAVRFADPGTVIRTTVVAQSDGVTIAVENAGPTIPVAHQARLFDRFYREDPSRQGNAESNGLGLSIVRSIMTLHRGAWHVRSADGVTCFSLTFPKDPIGEGDR
jgi:two-component system heavy metal sensor histidine kinase CusS